MSVFNRNRYIGLVLILIISLLGWYSTILLTNKSTGPIPYPDRTQMFGLVIALLIGFAMWISECYIIIPR